MKHESWIDKAERIGKWSAIGLILFLIWLSIGWLCLYLNGEVAGILRLTNISFGARLARFGVCTLILGGLVWLMLPKRKHGTR